MLLHCKRLPQGSPEPQWKIVINYICMSQLRICYVDPDLTQGEVLF